MADKRGPETFCVSERDWETFAEMFWQTCSFFLRHFNSGQNSVPGFVCFLWQLRLEENWFLCLISREGSSVCCHTGVHTIRLPIGSNTHLIQKKGKKHMYGLSLLPDSEIHFKKWYWAINSEVNDWLESLLALTSCPRSLVIKVELMLLLYFQNMC